MDEIFSGVRINDSLVQLSSGQIIRGIHTSESCYPKNCPLHRPSDHEYRDLPLYFNGENMVRITNVISEEDSNDVDHIHFINGLELIIDPDDYEYNNKGGAILQNAAKCLKCESIVSSNFISEYARCECGNLEVSGGFRSSSVIHSNDQIESLRIAVYHPDNKNYYSRV